MTPELIADYQCVCGEGPMWHPLEKRVYWVDIPPGKLFRYDPATGEHEQCYQDVAIGGFTVQADGALLLFMDKGMVKVWREGSVETILDGLPGEEDSRFNDVIADPEGRVFCGTMASPNHLGRLYRMDVDGSITQILDGIGCSNGMGFTPDRKQMYYTDSPLREISVFDYDQASGEITNRRVFAKTEGDGGPDGMTVDAEGCVWSARWDGGCLVRYSPDGQEMQRVSFPAKKVSSVIFGGEDYKDIYVTTAGGDNKPAEGEGAGALFRVNLGIKGVPEFLSKVRL
ncbi:MAG: SMP-30/gluconolactonase/LRE family protein [Armatimonadetes bacterium]|nr:SMP-30/gluconolactonase/LRE family protein [Armatimonadota bacterium]